jgi:outer membrane protein
MKKSITIILTALAFVLGSAPEASAQARIGTVDMKAVFDKYWRTKEAEAKMNEVRAGIKRELDERAEKRKSLESDAAKLNDDLKKPEISDTKKKELVGILQKKSSEYGEVMKDLQQFTQEKEKQLLDQTSRIRNGIVDDIKKVVGDIVKTEGYDIVFDTSGQSINQVPVVLQAKESYSFTEKVISKLNADRPKGSDKPADAPAATPADAGAASTSNGAATSAPKKNK